MLKDEFNNLVRLFQEGTEGKLVNLNEVFEQALEFFNHLKEQIQKGSEKEKQEAIQMMGELYTHMMAASKKITETSGLSEEQLISYAENPANFTPEQWNAIQESREQITQAGQELSKLVEGITPIPPPEKKTEGGKSSKKSHWMRS